MYFIACGEAAAAWYMCGTSFASPIRKVHILCVGVFGGCEIAGSQTISLCFYVHELKFNVRQPCHSSLTSFGELWPMLCIFPAAHWLLLRNWADLKGSNGVYYRLTVSRSPFQLLYMPAAPLPIQSIETGQPFKWVGKIYVNYIIMLSWNVYYYPTPDNVHANESKENPDLVCMCILRMPPRTQPHICVDDDVTQKRRYINVIKHPNDLENPIICPDVMS